MATKSSKGKKRKSSKRSYTTKAQKQEKARKDSIRDELILIVTFVLTILLILSNFDLGGKAGKTINKFIFGLLGFIGYLMPIILFCLVVFLVANRGNKTAYVKTVSFIVLIGSLAALIQLISSNKTLETVSGYYKLSSVNRRGGGLVGGAIVNLIHPLFGTAGSYVIIIGVMLICLLFLTGKTLFIYLARKSRKSLNEFRQVKEEARLNGNLEASKSKERRPARTFLLKDKFKNLTLKKK